LMRKTSLYYVTFFCNRNKICIEDFGMKTSQKIVFPKPEGELKEYY